MSLLSRVTSEAFRRRTLRRAISVARPERPDLAHLSMFKETVLGPVQRDEALMLHGLVRVLRPATVVEFGFLRGHSALNFVLALDAEARLYSFDIHPRAERLARERLGHDPRFTFRFKSQTEIDAADVDHRSIDFVFIDALHDLELNQVTFGRLLPLLAPEAVLVVHDTGTVPRELFQEWHPLLKTQEDWVGDEYEGQPGERAFVNWLREEHSDFAQLHLHSRRTIRCGTTVLQRSQSLPRAPIRSGD